MIGKPHINMKNRSGAHNVRFIASYVEFFKILPFVALSKNEANQIMLIAMNSAHNNRHRHFREEKTG